MNVSHRQAWLRGALGASIGVALWLLLTAIIRKDIAWMALVVGLLSGRLLRRSTLRGVEFVMVAVSITLSGALAGDMLAAAIRVGMLYGADLPAALNGMSALTLFRMVFDPLDGVFYAVAAYIAAAQVPTRLQRVAATQTATPAVIESA